ncbi:O-methyltransferase [Bradyrhizobium roseum]|uniref:hypothetical protein n=1 Tax=Bradyrhizobium roseum TaxID=3056648 RepID=UPI002606C9FC|nr:hypothetical protein [Bradyrhizobium roseus]WKA30616.1 hypothetical protein QUH67_10800 [Bradyrhizobium roseus]
MRIEVAKPATRLARAVRSRVIRAEAVHRAESNHHLIRISKPPRAPYIARFKRSAVKAPAGWANPPIRAMPSATGPDRMQNLRKNIRTLIGIADHKSRDHRKFYPWGFAMNGQTSRLEAVRQMIFAAEIARIIETGTYRGTTTEWFAQFGLPVETVETDERVFAFSKARLSRFPNVAIHLGSSVPFLRSRLADANINDRVLFYLDAHWENSLPLREELQIIFTHHPNSVIVIDDFQVRDDNGYHYDDYGPDRALTLDYVERSNLPAYHAFYPATPSEQETGARSGWIVLTPDPAIAERLRTIPLLRTI